MANIDAITDIQQAIIECFKVFAGPLTMGQLRTWIQNKGFEPDSVYNQIRGSCINLRSTKKDIKELQKILFYVKPSRTYRLVKESDLIEPQGSKGLVVPEGDLVSEDQEQGTTFALENHLRDYLARNLPLLEEGLQLWTSNPPSVEYPLEGRRIDILAKDSSNVAVVVELKLNRAYDKVIGQALLYRGLVRKALLQDKVRIMLVAAEITDELKLAAEQVVDVTLYEYSLSMKVNKLISSAG